MSKKLNKFISFIIFLIIVGALFYRQKGVQDALSKKELEEQTAQVPSVPPSAKLEFQVGEDEQVVYQFLATASAQAALTLVKSQVKLDLKEYDFGLMIEGVDGIMADSKHYWAIYQNGEYAKTGIADLKLQKGDQLELKYEKINP